MVLLVETYHLPMPKSFSTNKTPSPNTLMKKNSALWHGRWGVTMVQLGNTFSNEVFSFVRENDQDIDEINGIVRG